MNPPNPGNFPTVRMRRLRHNATLREMLRTTRLEPRRLIQPLFVRPGKGIRQPITSMPGIYQLSVDEAVREARELASKGVMGVILFGIPADKDPLGKDSYSNEGIVQQAVRALKEATPHLPCDHGCLLLRIHRSRTLRRR